MPLLTPHLLDANIISLLGLETLPDEEKARLLDQMVALIEERVMLRAMETLTPELRVEFERLFAEEADVSEEERADFVRSYLPQIPEWITEEAVKLKAELLEKVSSGS